MPRVSDEYRGIALLKEALNHASPFKTARTQYIVLGDGIYCRALKAAKRLAVTPAVPIVTIDPCYRDKRKYRSSRAVTYVPRRAERYAFDQKALAQVDHLVIISICAHTPVYSFVARARKAINKRLKLYAVCAKCCFPGLRAASERINGHGNWQLLYPRGQPKATSRPRKAAELRWRARRKERLAGARRAAPRPKRSAVRPKKAAARPKRRGNP